MFIEHIEYESKSRIVSLSFPKTVASERERKRERVGEEESNKKIFIVSNIFEPNSFPLEQLFV